MIDFRETLRLFLLEMLVRSGMSVVERDFHEKLHWHDNEIRDDERIDLIEGAVRAISEEYTDQILDALHERGFRTENDVLAGKDALSGVIGSFVRDFETELRKGVPQ